MKEIGLINKGFPVSSLEGERKKLSLWLPARPTAGLDFPKLLIIRSFLGGGLLEQLDNAADVQVFALILKKMYNPGMKHKEKHKEKKKCLKFIKR